MTIAAAYLTSEGVVFGADSTTTVSVPGKAEVLQLFNHAQKIFEVGDAGQGRLGLCTWGDGCIGPVSHRTIAARLAGAVGPEDTVQQAAQKLSELVQAEVQRGARVTNLGYFLGGWDPVTHSPACWSVSFRPGAAPVLTEFSLGRAEFQGAPELFQRAFHGFDPRLPARLLAELAKQLQPVPPNLEQAFGLSFQAAVSAIPHGGLIDVPLREAIDFVHMYLHLTIKAFKFRLGPPICGGPIEIGFVSTDRPFRWVRHKRFDSAVFEEEVGLL